MVLRPHSSPGLQEESRVREGVGPGGDAEGFHTKGRAEDEAAPPGSSSRQGGSKGPTAPTEVLSPSPASPQTCNDDL